MGSPSSNAAHTAVPISTQDPTARDFPTTFSEQALFKQYDENMQTVCHTSGLAFQLSDSSWPL
jgi:hypothetical protein